MATTEDPIKRLRTSLDLKQGPFGKLFGVGQSMVSDWEKGAPLAPEKAVTMWRRHGSRLRGMGCSFESLLLARNGYHPRKRGTKRRRRAPAPSATDGDSAESSAA